MKKVLVISGHPNMKASVANRAILEHLRELLPEVRIHALQEARSAQGFDVPAEQKLLTEADVIVFDFPFYWFSVPGLLKEWFDEVLTHGFAYGSTGTALKGKTAVFSFTLGSPAEAYRHEAPLGYTVEELIAPLFSTAAYCSMKNADPVYTTGLLYIPGASTQEDLAAIESKAKKHAERLVQVIESIA